MKFSNKFKIIWWIGLLVILTILGIYRIHVGLFNGFDIVLFIFWFILFLFPIISEVSIFGINVKKDIENATNELKTEIKSSFAEIKNSINFQPTINFNNPLPASPEEYKEKVTNEVSEDKEVVSTNTKKESKSLRLTKEEVEKKTSSNEKVKERLENIFRIEKIVSSYLTEIYGENFKPQMKISDPETEKKVIADGVIIENNRLTEVIETKYVSSPKSIESFFFTANRFITKLYRLGWRLPVHFVIVSELMNQDMTILFEKEFNKLNFIRATNSSYPKIKIDLLKLEDEKISLVKKLGVNTLERGSI